MNILQNKGSVRKDPMSQFPPASSGKPVPEAWSQIASGEESTSRDHVYEASLRLVEAGLSVIPIEAYEGSKSPDTLRLPHPHDRVNGRPRPSWSIFKIRRPKPDELRQWHEMEGPYGLAVLGGAVSGGQYGVGLEVIDIDTEAPGATGWMEAVEDVGHQG